MTKSKYCFSENIGWSSSVLKPIKNFIPAGMTKKKEKAKPAKNKISEIGTITEIKYLSIPIKAGKTNRHIWYKTIGRASKNPTNTATLI